MNSLIEMAASDIREKISEIDDEISSLQEEKEGLEEMADIVNHWSSDAVAERLREMIIEHYGEEHDIKLAIFKPNSEYNDQGYDYRNPVLILVDSNFNEVDHHLNPDGYLIPESHDESNYYDATGHDLCIDDITIKF